MHLEPATAYLVADGGRASLLLRHGDGRFDVLAHFENPADHRPRRDTRGRVFASVGPSRSAVEPSSHIDPLEPFAADLAAALSRSVDQGAFERLVLVAPPKLLSALHASFPQGLASRIVGELAKDLTKHPQKELEEVLNAWRPHPSQS